MLDGLVLGGWVTLLALGALAIEFVVIVVLAAKRGKAPSAYLIANLLSGLFLILALRAALVSQSAAPIAFFLGLAGVAHLGDVVMRLRRPR